MCEETTNYLWALQDKLGHGATSQVYKAYNKSTGELVAAKVYSTSDSQSARGDARDRHNRNYRNILDHELEILKSANHENIVRYIAMEPVLSADSSGFTGNREALMIEYCNGGSLHNVLELPENRYGLVDDEFMLVFRHLTNGLKYLHSKNTIHRDIKPDNIMLSNNINGGRTYKLADLGVARLMNSGENAFTSLVGTEEYIHPDLYRAAVHDDRRNALRTALQTRVDFPFEVDLWSLGVTLYQCATGELPFQPFAGTRKDRAVMKHILDTKPPGCISGIETAPGGDITWSKTLPESCRLSQDLKQRLEWLLQRLLEANRNKLMTFNEFFRETDCLFQLRPIYYLNLKLFKLTCSYFEPSQLITKIYDELKSQNNGQQQEEYFCLFQNIPHPISKTCPMTIETFCEQLPIPTSRENPLVFYTFSPLNSNDRYCPMLHIPQVKPIRQYNDVAAACDWSEDMVGLFFYVKAQLIDYQHILKTAQCSTTVMQQHLKSNLLEFLCTVRSKLIDFRSIEELKNILDQIESTSHHRSPSSSNLAIGPHNPNTSSGRPSSAGNEVPPIGFSHLYNNSTNPSSNEHSLSPVTAHRSPSTSTMQLAQQSLSIHLRNYLQPYEEIKRCEKYILEIVENQFGGHFNMINDQKPFVNTLWSSDMTKPYASWIPRADKFLKELTDLNESFRKDRLLNTYNRLQSDSHFRRRKNLEQLYTEYVTFAHEECYPNLVQVFIDYNDWIKQRSNLLQSYQNIQKSYQQQCEDIVHYLDLTDDLRSVVYKNIRESGGTSSMTASECLQSVVQPPTLQTVRTHHQEPREDGSSHPRGTGSSGEEDEHEPGKTLLEKFHGTTKKALKQAEEGYIKLDNVVRQLRTTIKRK